MVGDPNINTVLIAVIGLLGTFFAGWMTLQQSKIHKAVNSTAAAAITENQRQQALINTLSSHASNLEQQLSPLPAAVPLPSPVKSVASILADFEASRPANPNSVKS